MAGIEGARDQRSSHEARQGMLLRNRRRQLSSPLQQGRNSPSITDVANLDQGNVLSHGDLIICSRWYL
jgi:hypothetical protein